MSPRFVRRAASLAAFVLIAACSEPAPAPAGAADTATAGDASGGLPDGQGDTAGPADTADSSDATSGDVAAVVCVAPGKGECDESTECGSGKYCDPCTRKCATERKLCEPCEADVQCEKAFVSGEAGSACIPYASGGSHCGLVCLGPGGCPQGYTCEQVGGIGPKQCVPKTKSCAPNSGACKKDADCPFQLVCQPEWGVCVKGCTTDLNCTAGLVCSLGHCVEPCAGDADCATLSAEAKCVDQHCKIPGGCLSSLECETAETHCDLQTHKCAPGCEIDGDCKDFKLKCEATKCVVKGCQENWECGFAQVCNQATKQCVKAEGPHCAVCDPQDEKVTACGGKPNQCLSVKDAEGNEKGSFCFLECSSDAAGPCPQGWGCQELKDDKGNVQGKVCVRQCWTKPVGAE